MSSELFNDGAVVVTTFCGPATVSGERRRYQISSTHGGANYVQLMPHQLREAAERAGLVEQENGDHVCPLCDNRGHVAVDYPGPDSDGVDDCVCPVGMEARRLRRERDDQALRHDETGARDA